MKNYFILLMSLLSLEATAQYCTPTANCSDDDFINNFTFNAISNLNSGGSNCFSNSYINTGLSTSVTKGNSYNLTVQSGPAWPQGFGIWIDYNKDNDFSDAGEFVWSSPNASTSQFSGNFTIPAGAATGNTRMRVRCQYGATIAANQSCSTFNFGETEDYTVNIQPNNAPPVANFTASSTLSCTGVINFSDLSTSNPTSWLWNFGDSTTSISQNPAHTYASNGTYTVTLIVTNAFGSDTLIKLNYITVSFGGGPSAPSCISYTRSYCCGFGITSVIFNTINNNSGPASAGYEDFACQAGTSVYGGQSYNISVTADTPAPHNIRVWIDWNNDAVFTDPVELVFSADNVLTGTSAVDVPPTATVNMPLRMRVSANYYMANILTPCDSIDYGQAEDYTVTVLENVQPPVAEFSSDKIITCDGTIQFFDASENIPVVWYWDFGDSSVSSFQNPVHTYTANGTYTVTLVATNLYGTDTISKTSFITVNLGGSPVMPSCTTSTLGYCCGYGIYNVTFGAINNTTSDGKEGYRDFSCEFSDTVTEGKTYSISVQTGSANPQDTKIWIDFNNDSTLDNSAELVFSSLNSYNPSGVISIPGGEVLNTPLRMRITSDAVGNPLTPCYNPYNGQTEDYGIIIVPNTDPPVSGFISDDTVSCDGIVSFNDTSLNIPVTWFWDFGDGNSDTTANPVHTYSTTGNYTIKLVVCNAFSCDSVIVINYINVASTTGGPIAAGCTPGTDAYCCGMGIYNVSFSTINNTTPDGIEGYMDYSCGLIATVIEGNSYNISIQTGTDYEEDVRVWIDFNNNGNFNFSELVFFFDDILTFHTGTIAIPAGAVKNTPLRMRIGSDYFMQPSPQPCVNVTYGQFEDYSVRIIDNTSPPIVDFIADATTTCTGVIQFANLTVNGTSYEWNFGDGGTSAIQNPSHTYSTLGTYTVTLISSNAYGTDTAMKVYYINFIDPPAAPNCTPITLAWTNGRGITNVTFGSINYSTNDGSDNYQDYTCAASTYLNAGQTYSIYIRTGVTDQEDVRVWIDYNNSGSFTASEMVFSSNNQLMNHVGTVTVPTTSVKNLTLRMRVSSDWAFSPSPQPCNNVNSGQVEDYSVIIINPLPPVADFSVDYSQQCAGIIQFTDSSQNLPDTWLWGFGDSTTSTLANPSHTYTASGTYTVTLITTNGNGSDTISKQITLSAVTVAAFTVSDDSLLTNETGYFTDNSVNADSWYWNFGDGVTSTSQNPSHSYSSAGVYIVTLTAINTVNSCSSQVSMTVWVDVQVGEADYSIPAAIFLIYPNPNDGTFTIELSSIQYPVSSIQHPATSIQHPVSSINIYNMTGDQVYKSTINSKRKTFNLKLPSGIYYIKVISNDRIAVVKMVVVE